MRLPQLTFGKVLAGTAVLLVATTGTAYAANTVGSDDIIDNSIKSIDIRNGSVGTVDIADGHVRTADILDGTVGEADLGVDAVQATEIQDNAIDSGEIVDNSLFENDLGSSSVTGSELGTITQRSATSATIPAGGNGSVTASCLAGERLISGGNDGFFDVFVVASRQNGNGWAVFAHNNSGGDRSVTAHAYCLQS